MDDSEFDKLFADKMRQAGAPDFSEDDWEHLSPALDEAQKRRWRVLPLWWLGALSGLLLCSNLGCWWMWQQSEKRSDAIQQEWQQIRQSKFVKRDTCWSKVVVYRYDTIYRTVVTHAIPGNRSANESVVLKQMASPQFLTTKAAVSNIATNTQATTGQPMALPAKEAISVDTASHDLKNARILGLLDVLPLAPVSLNKPQRQFQFNEKDLALVPMKRKHTARNLLLIPQKYRLGAGTGLVFPSANNLSPNTGYLFSMDGEIAFSQHLALTLKGTYCAVDFMGKSYDQSLGLPLVQSPGDDYVLKYFKPEEGLKPFLQLTLGMRYMMRFQNRVSPYLGLGYAVQWHLPFEIQFEYINRITGEEKEHSIEAGSPVGIVSLMDLNAGVRYRFGPHFYLQAGPAYQFKLDKNQPGIPRFWGINSSVLYEF